jgi:hypothetical protein
MPILALLLLAATPAEANAAGMRLYQAKRHREAAAEFRRALSLDAVAPSLKEQTVQRKALALAHFNLACSLALQRKAGQTCETEAYRSTIWQQVREAIAIDPARLERALADPDLATVRDTLAYQSLLGRSPAREADLPGILKGVTWWSEGKGAFGSLHELRFGAADATITSLVFDGDGNPLPKRNIMKGSWSLSGRTVTITFGAPPPGLTDKRLEGRLEPDGRFELKPLGLLRDEPTECDA